MESQLSSAQIALTPLRDLEEKLRHSISSETARRESFLLLRLNSKEQEIQDLIIQIQELKASQAGNSASMRSSLLDPAVNVLIQHLRKELDKAKLALEETQNELSAWKFTPDSNTGKRLMAKCRLLYQENEELGRMISSGRMAKLEGDLALQRNFSEEMKKSQSELDEFLLELDEDVEGMQSTIYFLQQQLRQTREQLTAVQKENDILRNSSSNSDKVGSLSEAHSHENSCHLGNLPSRKNPTGGSFYHPSSSHGVGTLNEWCNGPTQSSSKRNFEKILEYSDISNTKNFEKAIDEAEAANEISVCRSAEESGEMSSRSPQETSVPLIGKREDAVEAHSIADNQHRFHDDYMSNDSRGEDESDLKDSTDRFSGEKNRLDAATNIKSQDEKIVPQLSGPEKRSKIIEKNENGGGDVSLNLTKDDDKTGQTFENDDKKTVLRKRSLSITENETTSPHSSVNSNSETNSEMGKITEVDSCSKSEDGSSFTKRSRVDLTGNLSLRAKTE
uniref:EOG090X0FYD n=1 Tax=Simocephalus serrulatus TaxID=117539 RepID=A0A4Y7NPK0_9CRUS|nr:EOG090X0FYD [Simocephalus serrulatus]SVE94566.1 EOG090X0FYD [Simocephalus serrulatus]